MNNSKTPCVIPVLLALAACANTHGVRTSPYDKASKASLNKIEDPFQYYKKIKAETPKYTCNELRTELVHSDRVVRKATPTLMFHKNKTDKKYRTAFDISAMYTSATTILKKEYGKRC